MRKLDEHSKRGATCERREEKGLHISAVEMLESRRRRGRVGGFPPWVNCPEFEGMRDAMPR
jgi:hypothetical protein